MSASTGGVERIGVVHVTFDMRIAGTEQVIRNLVENTDSSKYDVSVLCIDGPLGPFGCELERKGFRVQVFQRKPGFDPALVNHVRQFILSQGTDVVHCHQYTPYVYGLLGALGTKAKVIFTEHGRLHPDIPRLKRVFLNPFFSMRTFHVNAISSATREALIRIENFPPERIAVIYNGIDDTRFRRPPDRAGRNSLGIPDAAFVLGTVARLDGIKNQAMMIRALGMLRESHTDIRLLLVGDGPERESLERLADGLHVASRVIFTGFREDTERFYAMMDIFLLTSFTEGTAMTLLEAMASRLPCIATGVGGNGEVVKDAETGLLVASDDAPALAGAIRRLMANGPLRLQLGAAGRRRFEERFTVGSMVQAYQALYDRVASPRIKRGVQLREALRALVSFPIGLAGSHVLCPSAEKSCSRP